MVEYIIQDIVTTVNLILTGKSITQLLFKMFNWNLHLNRVSDCGRTACEIHIKAMVVWT